MVQTDILPTEHPGEFIVEELDARGWAQADLAFVLGWDASQLNRLIKGQTDITPKTALMLEDAFGVPAEFFINLQRMHDLSKAERAEPGVKLRASWASAFPVREMIKRGWIEDGESSLLDLQMVRFFGKNRREDVPFMGNAPIIPHAAKKSSYDDVTPLQYIWLNRVKQVAETIEAPNYSEGALRDVLPTLRAHFIDTDDLGHLPALLLRCGVRLVLVEALPGSKIDGVCLWIDGQPVVGLTNRLDRLDNLCFVIRHEIEHVLNKDGQEQSFAPIDEFEGDAFGEGIAECEEIANIAAAEFCVPQDLLSSFILRKSPYISEKDMLRFAARVEINPAIVVGQIQNKTGKYTWLRKYLKSIRKSLLDWETVDGWEIVAKTEL